MREVCEVRFRLAALARAAWNDIAKVLPGNGMAPIGIAMLAAVSGLSACGWTE